MLSTVCSYDNNAAFASSAACCSGVGLVLGPGTVPVVLDDDVAEPGAALPPLHAANANAAAATTTDTPRRRPHTPCTRPPRSDQRATSIGGDEIAAPRSAHRLRMALAREVCSRRPRHRRRPTVSAPMTQSTSEEALPPEGIADPAALSLGALGPVGPLVDDVRSIVVLRANGIGDFVVAIPALEALRAAYPEARITYLGLPWHPELLEGRPGPWDDVDTVPPYPNMIAGAAVDQGRIDAFIETHRARRYDLAVQ